LRTNVFYDDWLGLKEKQADAAAIAAFGEFE